MSVFTWAEGRANAMTIWDIGLLKIYVMLFGMIVGAYFAPFVTQNVWWFVAAVLLLGARGGYRWLTAEAA